MSTIADYLTTDHKRCDDLFVDAENNVGSKAWERAEASFALFRRTVEHHFSIEEEILFPAFESATGNSNGPAGVMRSEHRQIRGLLSNLAEALAQHDKVTYLGHSESLNIMLQQHNMKEENILYPMTDRILVAQQPVLLAEMHRLAATA